MGRLTPVASPARRVQILSLSESGFTLQQRLQESGIVELMMMADNSYELLAIHLRYLLRVGHQWQHLHGIQQQLIQLVPRRELIDDIADEVHDLLLHDLRPYGFLDIVDSDEVVKEVKVTPGYDGLFYLEDEVYLHHLEQEVEHARLTGYDPDLQFNR